MDVSAEGGEVGSELGGVDVFDEDGEADVAEGYPGDFGRGGRGGAAGCGAGDGDGFLWGCVCWFWFLVGWRWRNGRRGRGDLFWPSWAPCRVGLGRYCNCTRAPGLDVYGWMVLPGV